MLSLHNAEKPRKTRASPRIGLAVAGGGPVGAIFELGALRAFDEAVDGLSLHELDVYVGISAGSFIVASLANNISSVDICRTFTGHPGASFRLNPNDFFRPDYGQYMNTAKRFPKALKDNLLKVIRNPGSAAPSAIFDTIGRCLPSGIFDSEAIQRYLRTVFESPGHTNDFRELECTLYLVAVNLDNGAAVRFGDAEHNTVPISRAVQASAALPAFYSPVEIDGTFYVDGALRRTLHASAALDEGVDLLLGVNPLVPFSSEGEFRGPGIVPVSKLIQGGLPMILSQTFRALIQSRMKVGFTKYRSSHPGTDLILAEPNPEDEEIFFANFFSFASRNKLCNHAYRETRQDLLTRADELDAILSKYGLNLNRDCLADSQRTLKDSLDEGYYGPTRVARDLSSTLEDLQRLLG